MTRSPKIDFHCHMLERRAATAGLPHSVVTGFGARSTQPGTAQETAERASYDPAQHVAMLDRLNLDAEVVSSTLVMQGTGWADAEREDELNTGINDEIARWVREYPARLIGSFTLPLQSERNTRRELERCADLLGMKVLQLPVCVKGTYLSEPPFHYLWELIEERGLVAFVHPDGTREPWFQNFSMWNSVGQPIEEAKFTASLIYEGVLERYQDLQIVMSHGGGYLPHYFGRLDRNVKAWPASTANISKLPSEYLPQLYYDTCLYEPAMLEALIARVGADRIVMGSDYPVGDPDPVGFVAASPSLTPGQVDGIAGGTVARLLGLKATEQLGIAVQ